MKNVKLLAMAALAMALMASGAWAQTQLDSVTIETKVEAGKVTAIDGGKVYLSGVDIHGGSSIGDGNLEVTSKTEAGSVTANGQGAEVNLASLLLHEGSTIGSIDGPLEMDVKVGDVTAHQGAKINVGGIHLNGSEITGALKVNGPIKAETGNLIAHEGAELGVASLLMDDSTAENININKMEAYLQDVTVEEGGQAYFSTLKMANGAEVGTVNFSGYSEVRSNINVPSGAMLNVASAVFDGAQVGDATLNLHAEVDGIEMSGDSTVMVGGVNFE